MKKEAWLELAKATWPDLIVAICVGANYGLLPAVILFCVSARIEFVRLSLKWSDDLATSSRELADLRAERVELLSKRLDAHQRNLDATSRRVDAAQRRGLS